MNATQKPPSGANDNASAKDTLKATLKGPDGQIKQETTA